MYNISIYSKLRNILKIKVLPPQEVTWELTDVCNLKCEFCSVSPKNLKPQISDLTYAEIKSVLVSMKNLGVKSIALSGGEPLTRSDIWEIISLGNVLGFDTTLLTNGTLLPGNIDRLLRAGGIHSAKISLHAPDPEQHDQIVGVQGAWKKTLEGISSIVRLGIPVTIYSVIYKRNVNSVDKMVEIAERMGCSAIHFLLMMPTGRGKQLNNQVLPTREILLLNEHFEILRKIRKIKIIFKKFPCLKSFGETNYKKYATNPGCPAGITSFAISPKGDVSACVLINRIKKYIVGNVKEEGLDEIWYGSKFFNEIRHLDEKKHLFEFPCNSCPYFSNCRGGYLIEKLIFGRGLYSPGRFTKELLNSKTMNVQ